MTTLVTGGLGTVGSWVNRRLIEEHEQVICLDNLNNLDLIEDIKDQVTVINADILNMGEIIRLLKKHQVDSIVHTAALLGQKVQSRIAGVADPVLAFETPVLILPGPYIAPKRKETNSMPYISE